MLVKDLYSLSLLLMRTVNFYNTTPGRGIKVDNWGSDVVTVLSAMEEAFSPENLQTCRA